MFFFFSSRRRHTRCSRDWSSDVCSSDLVMQLYRHHIGSHAIKVRALPDGLDVVASRRGDSVYLHVANTSRRSEEHTSELQSRLHLVCRLLLEKKKQQRTAA